MFVIEQLMSEAEDESQSHLVLTFFVGLKSITPSVWYLTPQERKESMTYGS